MLAGTHRAISLVVWCQISVVDSSLSVAHSCYRSPPLLESHETVVSGKDDRTAAVISMSFLAFKIHDMSGFFFRIPFYLYMSEIISNFKIAI